MLSRIRTILRREDGASAVEYGLLVAGIAAVIIAAVFVIGNVVNTKFQDTGSAISAAK